MKHFVPMVGTGLGTTAW